MKRKAIWLLPFIYLAFIALGLPDALLGSSWNLVREDLNQSLDALGMMTLVVYVTSIISTFNAPRLLRFFQTKAISVVSVFFTALALIVISRVDAYWQMLVLAIPLGIGAGAIDVSLNHYLATHYKAVHMNFLHSFYGIGVTLGPTIMAYTLREESWRNGYLIVGGLLLFVTIALLASWRLWDHEESAHREEKHAPISFAEISKTKGAINSILIFLIYTHIETLGGVWIASYFFLIKQVDYSTAALFTSVFYLVFAIGRALFGLISMKVHPHRLILLGEGIMMLAGILMLFQFQSLWPYFIIVGVFGLGAAPVYPNMMFMNSQHFESRKLSRIMSLQMAIGYMGIGVLTPLAGVFFRHFSIQIYPYFVIGMALFLFVITARFFRLFPQKNHQEHQA